MQMLAEQSNNFQSNMLKFNRKLSIHMDTSLSQTVCFVHGERKLLHFL